MIKTISAALLAVTVLAAPALAATANTNPAPVTKSMSAPVANTAAKTVQAPSAKIAQAPVIRAVKFKKSVLNANARMGRHRHFRHHHRFHR
jgi:hypothetical protein